MAHTTTEDPLKTAALHVLKAVFEQGDMAAVDRFVQPDCVQHHPLAPDGAEALKDLAAAFRERFPNARHNVERAVAEGDFVAVHAHLVATPGTRGTAVADTFRFQDGRVAEHWHVEQDVPENAANDNGMFSTQSSPRDRQAPGTDTHSSKALVDSFFEELLVKKDPSAGDRFIGSPYYQHNPLFPNGVEAEKAGLTAYFEQFPHLTVTPIHTIAEGDLVVVYAHFVNAPGERGQAIVDLFRVRDGKVVEHWDVIQDVPEESANNNTMF